MALPALQWKALARPLPWRRFSPVSTTVSFLVSDTVALMVASFIGFGLWDLMYPVFDAPYNRAWAVVLLGLVVNAVLRLYPGVGLGSVETIRRVTISATMVHLLLAAALFKTSEDTSASRGAFFVSWSLTVFLVPAARSLVAALLSRSPAWGMPVVVLGSGRTGRLVVKQARQNPTLALKPVAAFDDDPEKQGLCEGVPVLGPLREAEDFARSRGIGYAIVAMPGVPRRELIGLLSRWSTVFPHVIVIPDLFGMTSLGITPLDLGGMLALEIRYNLLNHMNRWFKRAFDLVVSITLSIAVVPLLALCALAIMIANPGPVFYTQEREGEKGRKIRVFKLRTMYCDAERLLQEHLERDAAARDEWDSYCKLKRDPRILPGVGHLLRRTSLDELPQLWNIVLGEMSLVGPRPFPAYHNARFDPAFRNLRLRVTPGLTGLWQVSARSDGDLDVQAELDGYYIRNWSIWLDAYILVRTVGVVLFPRGAY